MLNPDLDRVALAEQFAVDVRHVHSVTFVTPFSTQPRLSLTGWFREIPL